jgi:cystathionine gamma-synthase
MDACASRNLAPEPGKDRVDHDLPQRPQASTIAAQAGGVIDMPSGGVVPPVQPSTTFVRDEDYALVNPDNIYSRDNSDIVRITETVLARLERR